jgi:hypothetical protein
MLALAIVMLNLLKTTPLALIHTKLEIKMLKHLCFMGQVIKIKIKVAIKMESVYRIKNYCTKNN